MRKVAIVTDSTNDLSEEIIKDRNIFVIPLYVNFSDEVFLDGIDIKTPLLYEKVKEKNELPKTAAVSPADFIDFFQKLINEDYDIIYTGISSKMSGTFQNANIAKEEFSDDRIYLVDSQNLSTGIGLLLLKACDLRDQGLCAKDIALKMKEIVPKIKSQFTIETMEYLWKGGRCSGIVALVGTVLKIKPIICVRNGEMSVGKKPRGKIKIALDTLLKQIYDDKDNLDLDYVMVTHSIAPESATYLLKELKENIPAKHIYETQAGCVISSHCGKGTIGILYITK